MKDKFIIGENDINSIDLIFLNRLLRQLNPAAQSVDREIIKKVAEWGIILTLRDVSRSGILIGMGTLVPIRKLISFCGIIEDVVVDDNYRGQGLGRKIMDSLIKKGTLLGMLFLDLTSNPKREAANKLYQSMGFELRKTNPYRLYLNEKI